MNDDADAELDLSCGVCGQSACLTDVTPIQFEHAVDTWSRVHDHTVEQMSAYYASAERVHGAHQGDSE